MPATNVNGKQRFSAAFRDCIGKGMTTHDALASSLGTTRDADPPGIKRDNDGKFTSGGGGSKSSQTPGTPTKSGSTITSLPPAKGGFASFEAARNDLKSHGFVGAGPYAKEMRHPSGAVYAVNVSLGKTKTGQSARGGKWEGSYRPLAKGEKSQFYPDTTKDEEPIEGAREVLNSILELHAKVSEHLEGHEHGEHGHDAHGKEHAGAAHAAAGHAPGPVHNVHGAGTPAPAPHAPKAPAVTAPVVPHVPPIPKAAAPATPKAVTPKVAAPATAKVAAAPAPKAPTGTAPKPPATKDSKVITYHKDAAARFRATVRDAVRENMPLPKIIEMGVISGTASNEATKASEGPEYKPTNTTKDAFTAAFRDAVARGVPTTDALKAALSSDAQGRAPDGKFSSGGADKPKLGGQALREDMRQGALKRSGALVRPSTKEWQAGEAARQARLKK